MLKLTLLQRVWKTPHDQREDEVLSFVLPLGLVVISGNNKPGTQSEWGDELKMDSGLRVSISRVNYSKIQHKLGKKQYLHDI